MLRNTFQLSKSIIPIATVIGVAVPKERPSSGSELIISVIF